MASSTLFRQRIVVASIEVQYLFPHMKLIRRALAMRPLLSSGSPHPRLSSLCVRTYLLSGPRGVEEQAGYCSLRIPESVAVSVHKRIWVKGPARLSRTASEIVIRCRDRSISKVDTVNVVRAAMRSIDVIRVIVFDRTGEPQIPSSGGRAAAGDHRFPRA